MTNNTTGTPAYMSVSQASNYSTLSERTLRELIAKGKIRAIRKGRRIILRTTDIDKYLIGESNND